MNFDGRILNLFSVVLFGYVSWVPTYHLLKKHWNEISLHLTSTNVSIYVYNFSEYY